MLPSLLPAGAENTVHQHPRFPPWSVPCPAVGYLPSNKTRDREAVGTWEGARDCGAEAPGSLITSACSAPAPSKQLPSNTREFNSSINRRESLHFGERWRVWVGLGQGYLDSTESQARKNNEQATVPGLGDQPRPAQGRVVRGWGETPPKERGIVKCGASSQGPQICQGPKEVQL